MAVHTCKQEARISALELNDAGQSKDIQTLIKRLDGLIKGIWALVLVLIPTSLSLFGYLFWQLIISRLKEM